MKQTIWVRNSCLATTIIGTNRFGAIQGWNQLLAGVHRNLLATRPDAHPLVCLSTWDAEQRNQSCRKKSIKCKHFYTQAENKKTLKGGESFDWNLLTNWVSAPVPSRPGPYLLCSGDSFHWRIPRSWWVSQRNSPHGTPAASRKNASAENVSYRSWRLESTKIHCRVYSTASGWKSTHLHLTSFIGSSSAGKRTTSVGRIQVIAIITLKALSLDSSEVGTHLWPRIYVRSRYHHDYPSVPCRNQDINPFICTYWLGKNVSRRGPPEQLGLGRCKFKFPWAVLLLCGRQVLHAAPSPAPMSGKCGSVAQSMAQVETITKSSSFHTSN